MNAHVQELIEQAELPVLVPGPRVAEFFGISLRTLRNWIAKGKVREVYRTAPGGSASVLIPRSEIARLLEGMRL